MKGPEDDVTDRVVGIISRYSMFPPCARVGVAVSGGADSVCLLALLHELRGLWNLRITVLHLNHLLRGSESDADQSYVEALADRCGLPLIVQRTDVAAIAEDAGENLEQAAREARRAFFRAHIEAGTLDRIALGHTRSDQAETVLFRLLRGAYTTGLAGIRPVTQDGIVRPLLDVDRGEVEHYLREHGIPWREDSSNRDLRFARNRIRHELLPSLSSAWNPALPEILAGHALLAQEDEQYWNREVDRVAPEILRPNSGGDVIASVRQLTSLLPALRRRVIRRAFELVRGDLRRIDFGHVEATLQLAAGDGGHARLQAPGVDVLRSFDWVRFAKPANQPPERDFDLALEVPGQVRLPHENVAVCAEIIERQPTNRDTDSGPHVTLKSELDWRRVRTAAEIRGNSGNRPLVLRNWRPGDAYQPYGSQHEQKIKALFQSSRVPLWERRHWPVVTAGGRIIWSRRFGPANEFVPSASSDLVLRIEEHPVAGS
jgi:tRNA(Ile)-lysidine synthase